METWNSAVNATKTTTRNWLSRKTCVLRWCIAVGIAAAAATATRQAAVCHCCFRFVCIVHRVCLLPVRGVSFIFFLINTLQHTAHGTHTLKEITKIIKLARHSFDIHATIHSIRIQSASGFETANNYLNFIQYLFCCSFRVSLRGLFLSGCNSISTFHRSQWNCWCV